MLSLSEGVIPSTEYKNSILGSIQFKMRQRKQTQQQDILRTIAQQSWLGRLVRYKSKSSCPRRFLEQLLANTVSRIYGTY